MLTKTDEIGQQAFTVKNKSHYVKETTVNSSVNEKQYGLIIMEPV
jgi:hypothetical protein